MELYLLENNMKNRPIFITLNLNSRHHDEESINIDTIIRIVDIDWPVFERRWVTKKGWFGSAKAVNESVKTGRIHGSRITISANSEIYSRGFDHIRISGGGSKEIDVADSRETVLQLIEDAKRNAKN